MLNKQMIMSMLTKVLPRDKIDTISRAYDMANQITDMTNNPQVALQKAGVTLQDLEKAKSLINNPLASMFIGDKKDSILSGLDKARALLDNTKTIDIQSSNNSDSELDRLQNILNNIK